MLLNLSATHTMRSCSLAIAAWTVVIVMLPLAESFRWMPSLASGRRTCVASPPQRIFCSRPPKWSASTRRARGVMFTVGLKAQMDFGMDGQKSEYEQLMEMEIEDEGSPPWSDESPLLVACREGNADKVLGLMGDSPLQIVDDRHRTCLHYACHGGDEATVGLILTNEHGGALAHAQDQFGGTPLHVAAERGHTRLAMMIGDKVGSSILPLQDANQYTCLHYAAEAPNDNVELVKYLAELGGMELVAQTDLARQTCLHCAAFHGNLQVVEYLTDLGGKELFQARDSYSETAMDIARDAVQDNPKALKVYKYLKKQSFP